MANLQTTATTTHLQMFAQPTVLVVSGWGGTGKTQTIARALQGLGRNVHEVGVIINERSQSSVEVDLARLPSGFEKLGLHGCACCSQLSEVLSGIHNFAAHGRKLTFIEQSPLSVTGDLRNGLRQRGYDNLVVFLFNPAQFNDAPAIQVQGIRDADLVIVTHQAPGSPLLEKANRIIRAAREDLSQVSVFVDGNPASPLPTALWQALMDLRQPKKPGIFGVFGAVLGGRTRPVSDFQHERDALVAQYSEVTVRSYHSSADEVACAVQSLADKGIVLSRVKGALANGMSVDVVQQGSTFLAAAGDRVEGGGYLSLRSFKTKLGKHAGDLAAHIGTPDCSPNFVQQVIAGYPTAESIQASVRAGLIPFGFESDRFMTDLRLILPHIRFISDATRRQELGMAIVSTMRASMETRLSLIKAINESGRGSADTNIGLLNAYYGLLTFMCDGNLQMFFKHPSVVSLHERLRVLNPAEKLLQLMPAVPAIRFEGRKDLSREDVRQLVGVIRRAKEVGYVTQAAVDDVFKVLEQSADPDLHAHRSAIR